MTISRNTFDPAKNYKRIAFHEDRQLLDSELNESQAVQDRRIRDIADQLLVEGAVLEGLDVAIGGASNHVLTIAAGKVYLEGHVEDVPEAVLTFDPEKTSGVDTVYLELLKLTVGLAVDPTLVNPRTGEPTAERERWVTQLKDSNTTADSLPDGATERRVVALFAFDRAAVEVSPVVAKNTTLRLEDLQGTKVNSPASGQILRFDAASSAWKNEDLADIPGALDDLEDVALDATAEGQVLQFDAATERWRNVDAPDVPSNLADLNDVSATTPVAGNVIAFDGAVWVPSPSPRWTPLTGVTRTNPSQLGNLPMWVKNGLPLRIRSGSDRYYGILCNLDPENPTLNWLGPSLPTAFDSVEAGTPDMVFEIPYAPDHEQAERLHAGGSFNDPEPVVFAPRPVVVPESYACGVAYAFLVEYPPGYPPQEPFDIHLRFSVYTQNWNSYWGSHFRTYYEDSVRLLYPILFMTEFGEVCGVVPLRQIYCEFPPPYVPPKNFLLGAGIPNGDNTFLEMTFDGGYPDNYQSIVKLSASILAVRVGENDPDWDAI
jgi:hypothetical protein